MNFLENIIDQKKSEIQELKKNLGLSDLKNIVRGLYPKNNFRDAVTRRETDQIKIIAEIKRASPSKGVIAEKIEPAEFARDYEKGGASAISVLTEKNFFKGSSSDLTNIRNAVPGIPLLRKDFIVDEYQIYESVQIGADAILLIVAALDEKRLMDFMSVANDLHLSSLVEVHSEKELEIALSAGAEIIGVNNRNLTTFEVSTAISEELAEKIPDNIVSISESGIKDLSGLQTALESGYHAVLIGEHFMRSKDRVAKVKEFVSYRQDMKKRNNIGLKSGTF